MPGVRYWVCPISYGLRLTLCTLRIVLQLKEADALVEKYEVYHMRPGLHLFRGVFLMAMGAEEAQIEASFLEAIRIAKAEVGFVGETRRSNLCGIPSPKSERVRRMWSPVTSLVTGMSSVQLTQRIGAAERILRIDFLDHLIVGQATVGRPKYFSQLLEVGLP